MDAIAELGAIAWVIFWSFAGPLFTLALWFRVRKLERACKKGYF